MPVDDLKQIVDNVYLQGAHAAFVQITKFYSKKMDKLDKKTLSSKILTSDELNEVKQCTSLMKNLNEIETEFKKKVIANSKAPKNTLADDETNKLNE